MLEVQCGKIEKGALAYQIFGRGPVEVVIEMGLGACIGEWYHVAQKIGEEHTVLLYERAGIDLSSRPQQERSPQYIAKELNELLSSVDCLEKLILIGHSQGGLYVQQYARMYPQSVKGVIFLDPLSPEDNIFRSQLSKSEYKKSGVDKTGSFKLMKLLGQLHLGGVIKTVLKSAPPFYYYPDFSKDAKDNILNGMTKPLLSETALAEYKLSHEDAYLKELRQEKGFPEIPIVLVTHNSEKAIKESMLFGHNTRDFAAKVEDIWQRLMKDYLKLSPLHLYIEAVQSTHHIHLMDPNTINQAISWIEG